MQNFFESESDYCEKGLLPHIFLMELAHVIKAAFENKPEEIYEDIQILIGELNNWIEYDNHWLLFEFENFIHVIKKNEKLAQYFIQNGLNIYAYDFTEEAIASLSEYKGSIDFAERYYKKVKDVWPEINDLETFKFKTYDDKFG